MVPVERPVPPSVTGTSVPPDTYSVPVVAGIDMVVVPSAPVTGANVIVPLVALRKPILPTALPAVPSKSDVVLPAVNVVNVPAAGVAPPIAPGLGKLVMLADPSKLLPPIVRAEARAVAVAARRGMVLGHAG